MKEKDKAKPGHRLNESPKPVKQRKGEQEDKINLSDDKEINYLVSLIKEISSHDATGKGKSAHRFGKAVANLTNHQLIEIADFIARIIEKANVEDPLLESMMDNVLGKIEGQLD